MHKHNKLHFRVDQDFWVCKREEEGGGERRREEKRGGGRRREEEGGGIVIVYLIHSIYLHGTSTVGMQETHFTVDQQRGSLMFIQVRGKDSGGRTTVSHLPITFSQCVSCSETNTMDSIQLVPQPYFHCKSTILLMPLHSSSFSLEPRSKTNPSADCAILEAIYTLDEVSERDYSSM